MTRTMNNDLISRSEAKKLGATCLAKRNDNGQLEAIISLDNAPTVRNEYMRGYEAAMREYKRPQGEWIEIRTSCAIGHKFYYCSKCNREIDLIDGESLEDYPFCHCGADMREGGAE